MSTSECIRLKRSKEILEQLRSIWTQIVLQGDDCLPAYTDQILHLIKHPLKNAHPLSQLFTALLSKKLGQPYPPLNYDLGALTMGELCQAAILQTLAGIDGQSLGQIVLSFSSFPSLWSRESEFHIQDAKTSIHLLFSAFGKELTRAQYENPYFSALAKVLPRMDISADSLAQSQERGHSFNLGDGIENVFVTVGDKVPLGAMKAGDIEIPAFGPQVYPLNNPSLFGVYRKIPDTRWASLSLNHEIWFEYFSLPSHGGIEIRFIGLTPEIPVYFVFYVKAELARIDQEIYLPKSLRRYCNASKKVVFEKGHSLFSIENTCPGKMELIPLAGEGCFWDSDFLLSFEIPVHDGRAVFQFMRMIINKLHSSECES